MIYCLRHWCWILTRLLYTDQTPQHSSPFRVVVVFFPNCPGFSMAAGKLIWPPQQESQPDAGPRLSQVWQSAQMIPISSSSVSPFHGVQPDQRDNNKLELGACYLARKLRKEEIVWSHLARETTKFPFFPPPHPITPALPGLLCWACSHTDTTTGKTNTGTAIRTLPCQWAKTGTICVFVLTWSNCFVGYAIDLASWLVC